MEDQKHDTLLYAGDLQVHITDWFFFKNKAELKFIGLQDATLKFQRSDSVWSQQFLFDYFSSNDTSKQKKGGIEFNLKKVALKNVNFLQKDAWTGNDMNIHIGGLQLDANEINFSKKIIEAARLEISEPVVSLYKYDGNKPERKSNEAGTDQPDSSLQWNPDDWKMYIARLKMENGIFRTNNSSPDPVLKTFDGQHIEFGNINGEFKDVRWDKDSITAHMDLQTKERSGFEVKSFLADAKFTPKEMSFSNLDIHTNKSVIKNFFSMSYDDFSDMDDFLEKIKMTGNFTETEINSDDIAFFAPELRSWKKDITLKGKVRGSVSELAGKDLLIRAGNNTLLNGDITLTGLPNIDETFIDFKANDFRTNYSDAVTIVPELKGVVYPDLRKILPVHFTGSFTGFIHDFVTFGTIETNLGTVKSDLNMKLPEGKETIYSGNISTENFQLGRFLNDEDLGAISMSGMVKGSGLKENTRNVIFDGKVNFIEYNNYRYNNITINGKLDKKLFDGLASINDTNAVLTMDGKIDFNNAIPVFDLSADVKTLELQKLNLTKENMSFSGKLNLNFSGNTPDNFTGIAKISEGVLKKDGTPLSFDSLTVSSGFSNGIKTLTARSNEFEGTITGRYSIKNLPDAFKTFLNKYYPSYVKAPLIPPTNESFTFDIITRNVEDYLSLIHKDIKGFNNSHISGRVDLSSNHFDFDASVPDFSYRKYVFSDVEAKGTGTLSHLSLNGKIGSTFINDSLNFPLTTFRIDVANDSSRINISTSSNLAINKANVGALVHFYRDTVKIKFDTSSFSVNGKTWTIENNGELTFGKNSMAQGKVILREGQQEISLNTQPSSKGNWNDLNVEMKKVNLGDLSPMFLPKNRLEGVVSGKILVEDPYKKFNITGDVQAEQILLDNDSLGNFIAHVDYQNENGELKAKGKNTDAEHSIDVDLDLFLDDKEKAKSNRITAQTVNYPIKIIERFVGDLFSEINGYVTGPIQMTGPLDELNFSGKLKLHDGGLKVNFTQCYYTIEDTYINLKPTEINLDGIVLKDPVTKNPVYLNGYIQHQSFKDMFFYVRVQTRKIVNGVETTGDENNRPVLLLNTTFKDNQQFYGRVTGTGSFWLEGPESQLFMQISAIASNKDSSSITIPPSRNRESGLVDFLVEKKYGREMSETELKKNADNITYDLDVTASEKLNVKIVLDELTNDEIKGRAKGTLHIRAGTVEPLRINGRLDILDGRYLFTFQSFFKKPFELKKGEENYIEWTGDPENARIHFDAIYKAENVSFAPLANVLLVNDESLARYRDDVYVVATLTGHLFKPNFNFSLEFPPNSQANTDPSIAFTIQQLEKNPNEIHRQVTFLIVLNSFATPENTQASSTSFGTTIAGSAVSSLSGLMFNEVNKFLNKSVSKIFKNSVSVNFSGSLYNRNLIGQEGTGSTGFNQGNVGLNIPVSLMKDRLVITMEGTLDIPIQSQSQTQSTITQSVTFLPNVTAEYLINPSGTLRVNIFYRQNLDYLTNSASGTGRTIRQGVSIAYKKDADTFWELFRKKPKKAPQQKLPETANEKKQNE